MRWSPAGDMIASASSDKTTGLFDFKTGKKALKYCEYEYIFTIRQE